MIEWVDVIVWFLGIAFGAVLMSWNYQRRRKEPIGTIKAIRDSVDGELYLFLDMDISKEELAALDGQEATVRIAQKIQ